MRKSRDIDPILDRVREILWEDWDPIGVNDEPAAFGEYDSYAQGVARRVLEGDSAQKLDSHLETIESSIIGLKGWPSKRARAVRKLVELQREIGQ